MPSDERLFDDAVEFASYLKSVYDAELWVWHLPLTFDPELLYTAAMFHDVGLTSGFRESRLRFEVDGATAARAEHSRKIAPLMAITRELPLSRRHKQCECGMIFGPTWVDDRRCAGRILTKPKSVKS
jgi:hypothetical protein